MDPKLQLILALTAVVLVVLALAVLWRRRRTAKLRHRFGPEYARAVDEDGRGRAETQLQDRQKRVAAFTILPLGPGDKERFGVSWRRAQEEFVDNPERAATHADEVLVDVMSARGFPVTDFEQQAADLSVDHAEVVQNYRAAHDIARRHALGEAGTEDLRQAMIHYRALFDELVNESAPTHAKAS